MTWDAINWKLGTVEKNEQKNPTGLGWDFLSP
jgi:hypothetical protein